MSTRSLHHLCMNTIGAGGRSPSFFPECPEKSVHCHKDTQSSFFFLLKMYFCIFCRRLNRFAEYPVINVIRCRAHRATALGRAALPKRISSFTCKSALPFVPVTAPNLNQATTMWKSWQICTKTHLNLKKANTGLPALRERLRETPLQMSSEVKLSI